jgi:hypothetical protein
MGCCWVYHKIHLASLDRGCSHCSGVSGSNLETNQCFTTSGSGGSIARSPLAVGWHWLPVLVSSDPVAKQATESLVAVVHKWLAPGSATAGWPHHSPTAPGRLWWPPGPAAESAGKESCPARADVASPASLQVRAERSDGQIRTTQPVMVNLDDEDDEISVDGQVLGFIHRAAHVSMASAGTRVDRACECGQSVRWAQAISRLIAASGTGQKSTGPRDHRFRRSAGAERRRTRMVDIFFGPGSPGGRSGQQWSALYGTAAQNPMSARIAWCGPDDMEEYR